MSALDPSRRYLLYCDRGVMSELQAQSLAQAGLRNVGVQAGSQQNTAQPTQYSIAHLLALAALLELAALNVTQKTPFINLATK